MISLEKSELPFSKCPTKNYITPPPEKISIPLKRRTSITSTPHLYANRHAPNVFISFQFLYLRKLTMRNCVLVKLKQYLVIILRTERE